VAAPIGTLATFDMKEQRRLSGWLQRLVRRLGYGPRPDEGTSHTGERPVRNGAPRCVRSGSRSAGKTALCADLSSREPCGCLGTSRAVGGGLGAMRCQCLFAGDLSRPYPKLSRRNRYLAIGNNHRRRQPNQTTHMPNTDTVNARGSLSRSIPHVQRKTMGRYWRKYRDRQRNRLSDNHEFHSWRGSRLTKPS
jgi:hypothetical protein